jgi:hypothetical protein
LSNPRVEHSSISASPLRFREIPNAARSPDFASPWKRRSERLQPFFSPVELDGIEPEIMRCARDMPGIVIPEHAHCAEALAASLRGQISRLPRYLARATIRKD